jgi:phosphoserine aminotransferase
MRCYNFSSGPAVLPEAVLRQASAEMLEYGGTGMSVMEMSHRSKMYLEIIQEAEALLRELMDIPEEYKVLFLQGGASQQFAMVPLNLYQKGKADFVITGQWAKKARQEAAHYGTVNVVASSEDKNFTYIPKVDPAKCSPDADFFHFTMNNTIYGTRFTALPQTGGAPLVSDMSSCILSEEYDVSRFGIMYAGAQKNIGPAGVTVVIIRDDLIGRASPITPIMLNYKTHADEASLYNTPPTYAIYIAMLTFRWVKALGGVPAMRRINTEKAKLVYDFLDSSSLFRGTVVPKDRSIMNIPFVTGSDETDKRFIKEAAEEGLVNLAGHRTVGGMRASLYNAMPIEGAQALVAFMKQFEAKEKQAICSI